MVLILPSPNFMELNLMAKKSKLSKPVLVKKEAAEEVAEEDHMGHEALDVEEEDLGEVEEREEEGHQVLAITVTRKDTWQEIALKNEEKDEVDLVADEVEDVVEAEHVTIAMKKGTWQENVHQETGVKFGS